MKQRLVVDPSLTLEQLRAVIAEVSTYSRLTQSHKRPSSELLALMQSNELTKLSKATAQELTHALGQYIAAAKQILIRSAVALDGDHKHAIQTWFAQIAQKTTAPILVSFRTDPSLIAGVVVQTPNAVYDWSVLGTQEQGRAYLREMVHPV